MSSSVVVNFTKFSFLALLLKSCAVIDFVPFLFNHEKLWNEFFGDMPYAQVFSQTVKHDPVVITDLLPFFVS